MGKWIARGKKNHFYAGPEMPSAVRATVNGSLSNKYDGTALPGDPWEECGS